jgi:hypothetical protein
VVAWSFSPEKYYQLNTIISFFAFQRVLTGTGHDVVVPTPVPQYLLSGSPSGRKGQVLPGHGAFVAIVIVVGFILRILSQMFIVSSAL